MSNKCLHNEFYVFVNPILTIHTFLEYVFNMISYLIFSSKKKKKKNSLCVIVTVLKTGPDRPVRPVQPGTGSQSGPVNTPKTGQQLVKNRKTGQKPGKNRG